MGFSTVTFCAALLVLANAGPVYKLAENEERSCAVTCSDNNKFDYQIGNVYEFSYEATTTTKMNSASEDSATIDMNAKVEIEPLTKCDYIMRIKYASLRDSEDDQNSQAFKEAMTKQPLKFSFQDGRIDHVCAMDGESTWTLNIKRGILSAFQNSMDSLDRNQNLTETDVVGTCLSEYKVVSNYRKTKRVEKTKNLIGCNDREGYRLAVQSIGYNVPSFVKSLPLMKSEYKCTQTLDRSYNILQRSTCSEEHVFRPFSSGKNGAMTTSEQTLTFSKRRGSSGRPFNEQYSQRSTLMFQHQDGTWNKQEKEDKIEAKLQELCQKAADDIRPEVPEMVNQLIEYMRQVDRDVLSRVYRKINEKGICGPKADRIKQYFHDAIPMVGTAASIGMIQDLISKKYVTGSEAEMWLLSLSFSHHPTKEMIVAAMPLLNERVISGSTLLAISSLASSYCNEQPDCGKDSEISALVGKLITLTHECTVQNGNARRIVFALRALGNIGHSHRAVSHLTRCSTRKDVPEEIRIAAMDAFRRVPCDAMRSDLMGIFRDESEDSELRLNAYIALMKCPSNNVLSEVRQVLEKEKSNQVGSFVWTHLTNLMETSDPNMQGIRNIVQDEELKKEFNLDQRKFSKNYEGSFFLDSINTGAKVDSNIIFSEKSFIPRSANLNLTIDLFGHAINFLEFGGRVQGMEKIMEHIFGPSGTKMPASKSQAPINFDKSMDGFRASAFLRVFGNELRYWDEKSLNELQFSLRKLMNMQTVSFSKSMQLLDSRMIIPTCIGLPLNLTMTATGSMSLDAKASFRKSELHVDIRPSASVQVKGEMSVDAHLSRAGLKMVTVAHTSTGASLDIHNNKFDLQIPKKKMEIFNLKTDFYIVHQNTEKKQEMIVDNVMKHEICTGTLLKQVTGLTFCQTIKFPNASLHNEAPFFPFTGPVVYDLYIMNEDAPNGYQIEGFTKQSPYSFYIDTPNSKVSRRIALDAFMENGNEAQITFEAPWKNFKIKGTVVNMDEMKKLTGQLSLNGRTDYAFNVEFGMKNTRGMLSITPKFEVTIPQKKMAYEGKIEITPMKSLSIDMSAVGFIASDINLKVSGENVPKEIGLTTQLRIGRNEYYIATRTGKLVSGSGFKFTPSLKIAISKKDVVEFTSEIIYEANKQMSFDFKLNKLFPRTIAMNAVVLLNAGKTKTKHTMKVQYKSPQGSFRIIGDMDNKKTGMSGRVIGSYNFGAKYSDRLTLSIKIRNLSVKKSMRYMFNVALESKKQQSMNFDLKGQLAKAINHLETNFDLHYGNPIIKTNNLIFAGVLNRALKPLSHTYDFSMAIQHPGQNINYKVEVNHLHSSTWPCKKFQNTVMVQMAPGEVVQTKILYSIAKEKGLPKYEHELALSYPGRDMKIAEKLVQVNRNTHENMFTVQWQKGQEATVQSTYKAGKGACNIENTLRLPNGKEAKVIAMWQILPGSFKTKVEFAADQGLISRQRINYKAEGSITYGFKVYHLYTGITGEFMWAPNQKVSVNTNFDYMKKGTFSSKLAFATPFGALKNFDSEAKFTWINHKYTSMMSVSWNNQNELKQELSFVYPKFHLTYDASGRLTVSGKEAVIGVGLKLAFKSINSRINISHGKTTILNYIMNHNCNKLGGASLFVLDYDIGDSNGKMKITLKYNKPTRDVISTGEGNFPECFWSYNLKFCMDLSNLDMSYSSLTLNNKQMFRINANYGIKGDNIDMKADIIEPNGERAAVSGTINLSGNRKTGNVEMKSKHIDFSAEGAFEYEGPRSAGGELKTTTNGKSVIIRANYKKEGSTCMVTGTLGLPDGRSLGMEGSLDLQNIAASLKIMSPDFSELTEVEMTFSFNGDKQMFGSKASLKLMPYFDTTFDMGFDTEAIAYNMASTFTMYGRKKYELSASYKHLTELQFKISSPFFTYDFQFGGDLDNAKGTFTVLYGNTKYELTFSNKNFFQDCSLTVTIPKHVLKVNGKMTIRPKATSGNFNIIYNNKKLSLLGSYKDFGRKKIIKADLNTPYFKDSLTAVFNGKPKKFNAQVKVDHNLETYELTLSNKNVYEMIDLNIYAPGMEAKLDFEGELKKFKSFASVKIKNDLYRFGLSNDNYVRNIRVEVTTPQTGNIMFGYDLQGDLNNFSINTIAVFNKNKYEVMVSTKNYFREISGKVITPQFGEKRFLVKIIKLMDFSGEIEIENNNEIYKTEFSLKNREFHLTLPKWMKKFKLDFYGTLKNLGISLHAINYEGERIEMTATSKNFFQDMLVHIAIPHEDDIHVAIKRTGNLRIGEGTMDISAGKIKAEMEYESRQDSFSSKGYIEQDGNRLAGYTSGLTHVDGVYDFDFNCDYYDYYNTKQQIDIIGKKQVEEDNKVTRVTVKTPFKGYEELYFTLRKNLIDYIVEMKLEVDIKIPNQHYTLDIDLGTKSSDGYVMMDFDVKNQNQKYRFHTSCNTTEKLPRVYTYEMNFPHKNVYVCSRYGNPNEYFMLGHDFVWQETDGTADLGWDKATAHRLGFELKVHKHGSKDGYFRLVTPRRTIVFFRKVGVKWNQYSTVGHFLMDENNPTQKVDFKADVMIVSNKADIDITVKFPKQKKGMNLKTSIFFPLREDIVYTSNTEFSMDQDPKNIFKMSSKLLYETIGKRQIYTMNTDVGHSNSEFVPELMVRVTSSPEKYNADVELECLNVKRKRQKFAVRGEMHRLNHEVNLKLEAPKKTIELDGSLTSGNQYTMSVLKKENGKEDMEALFKLNPKFQRMNIIFNYDEAYPNHFYRIDADIMKSKAMFKAYRTNKQSDLSIDGGITVELKTDNLFQSHIKWNPDLLQDLNVYGYQKLRMYRRELISFGNSLSQILDDEVYREFDIASRKLSEETIPIVDYFVTEFKGLGADICRGGQFVKGMVEYNSLYIRSTIEAIGSIWHQIYKLNAYIEVFTRYMSNKMDEAKEEFDFYYDQYSMQLRNKFIKFFTHCLEQYTILFVRAMEVEAEIVSFMKNYPEIIKELIDQMRQNPYGEKVADFLMEMYKAFNEKKLQAKEHVDTLTSAIYSAHATLNRHISNARRYPIVDYIMNTVDNVYEQILWSYNYWDVKDNVLGLKSTLYQLCAKQIDEIKYIITDVGMNTLLFDPRRGEIIVEFRIGAAKYIYDHLMSSLEDVQRAVYKLSNIMRIFNINVWDIYYTITPTVEHYYIPPFKAEASLFAGQLITTFDGRHHNYKGTCSYLLAHDYVDGNFTVVANFDANSKAKLLKSLTVTTAHSEQLEIFPDNKVLFNSRAVKLPLQLTDATMTREDNRIVLESKRGYKVICNHDLQLYTVQISGWYFNKVAGLFGTYNNEPSDDMLMSNKQNTKYLEQFAQSWSASSYCKSHHNYAPSHMVTENEECAYYFKQTDSPFSDCFSQVNPDQFYRTCAMHLPYSGMTSVELCTLTSVYQKKCGKKGVYLSRPSMCPRIW